MQVQLREYIRKTRFPDTQSIWAKIKNWTIDKMKEMRKDRRADQIAGSGQTASPCWRYPGRFQRWEAQIFSSFICYFSLQDI